MICLCPKGGGDNELDSGCFNISRPITRLEVVLDVNLQWTDIHPRGRYR